MTLAWKKPLRKGMETRLFNAAAAANPALVVHWTGMAFDRREVEEYVRFHMHYGKARVQEIGADPRIETRGFAKIGCFVKLGLGEDRLDTIAGIVAAAYPYNTKVEAAGYGLTVDTVDTGASVPDDDVWLYCPVDVNFTVWRTT